MLADSGAALFSNKFGADVLRSKVVQRYRQILV